MISRTTTALLWMEWRRRRLLVLLGIAWAILAVAGCVADATLNFANNLLSSFYFHLMLFGIAAPILLAMRITHQERTEQTTAFVLALPVSAAQRALMRLLGGVAVLALSYLSATLLMVAVVELSRRGYLFPRLSAVTYRAAIYAGAPVESPAYMIFRIGLISWCIAQAFYLYVAMVGTFLRREMGVAIVGILMAGLWLGSYGLARSMGDGFVPMSIWGQVLLPQSHFRGDVEVYVAATAMPMLALNMLLQCLVGGLFVVADVIFGEKRRGDRSVSQLAWLPRLRVPLRSQTVAMVWLVGRQIIPICLGGLLVAFLVALLIVLTSDPQYMIRKNGAINLISFVRRGPHAELTMMLGVLWAAVAAFALFASEASPRGYDAIRALPLNTGRLYLVKYVLGCGALLFSMNGLAVANYLQFRSGYFSESWFVEQVIYLGMLQWIAFSLAAMWICLLRDVASAALATAATGIGSALLFHALGVVNVFSPQWLGVWIGRELPPYGLITLLLSFIALVIVPTVIGWLTMRGYSPGSFVLSLDWGKNRPLVANEFRSGCRASLPK